MKISPMMQHYIDTKKEYEDCILFYRLGDFYEMFFEDAKLVSRELELTLTGKSCGLEERAPMCGVPHKAADAYIQKLVERGYRVAVCEQVEDPKEAKGIVKREVVKIVTPGTVTSSEMLIENENNYLACLYIEKDGMAISYCDISTGELATTETGRDNLYADIVNELVKIDPKELIINTDSDYIISIDKIKEAAECCVQVMPDNLFSLEAGENILMEVAGPGAVTASGLQGRTLSLKSLGALLSYLMETQKQTLRQITYCSFYETGSYMSLDRATLRNLEITETLYEKQRQGSLLGVLDKTSTAMGSRTMKKWLKEPLNSTVEINNRLDGVEEILETPLMENNIREFLKGVYDFERLAGKIASGSAGGKDMIALKSSLAVLPEIRVILDGCRSNILKKINSNIGDFGSIYHMIDTSISEDASYVITEGGLIKEGFSEELDQLEDSIKDAKDWIKNLEVKERERTGIKSLKVGFNKVFGYYIDIPRSSSNEAPKEYIRKQTLVNNERFITPELKEMESLVLNAEVKINRLQYDIFCEIRKETEKYIKELQETAKAIAALDVLTAFSYVSTRNGYVRPSVDNSYDLVLENGRHPVVEKAGEGGMFVSNSTILDNNENSFMVITGPNMSGKSTFMRQTALIVLMAQAGCFVPCDHAKIGVCDRIFTRIGASDNLSKGQSTFYVEMSELSYILNCATARSLIILDEIGRGTSTYDGLAIAWATIEYLCNEKQQIRTLFATHYHELTELENTIQGVKNLNVDVAEEHGNIVFLHKIVAGAASRSYGVHVAKLAGVPTELLENAEEKLESLEEYDDKKSIKKVEKVREEVNEPEQLCLFKDPEEDVLSKKIKSVDLMNITPSEAIRILEELKGIVK